VTPNRRGARSREVVLDAAERLMAEHGYDAATVAALVDEAGVPASSIYHYFGSKEGVLLAVMERGAERFFEALPIPDRRIGSQAEHLAALVEVAATLDRNPDFLRILVVMAAQPVNEEEGEVHRVVNRCVRWPWSACAIRCRWSSASTRRARTRTRSLASHSPRSTAPSSPPRRTGRSASAGFSSTCPLR
jgi:AcrR family transcriptional regulator